MKKAVIAVALALAVSTLNARAQDTNNPPPAGSPGHGPGGFHILPPRAQEQLSLTADQQKQVADLEAAVKAKLETILTPAQLEKLKQLRPPQRPGGKGGGQPDAGGDGQSNPPQPPGE